MAKKKSNKSENQQDEQNPEIEERKRLKKLAHTNNILSKTPSKGLFPLNPSKTVIKHHGKDIIKKSQRKNRYLLSFSGLIAPISGGKIGELAQLNSKNPILYLEFPQGRMKLLGTIIFPKNRYLTLQFSRGGKNVMCEDCFDSMIVFSEAYWVGKKDENPEEARLDFPKELYERKDSEFDFQGGAGAGAGPLPAKAQNKIVRKSVTESVEEESTDDLQLDDTETQSPERENNLKDVEYTTPVRHSERTSGKKFKFTEVSSGESSPESVSVMSVDANDEAALEENNEAALEENNEAAKNDQSNGISETTVKVNDSEDIDMSTMQAPQSSRLSSGEKKSSRSSLVQATISTLFKKVDQKSTTEDAVKIVSNKASKKSAQSKSKNKSVMMPLVPEASEILKEDNIAQGKKTGARTNGKKQKTKVAEVEDDIEDFSSPLEENDTSDDDWRA